MHWQILTKLCFLFKWVIFNLLPPSHFPPLLIIRVCQLDASKRLFIPYLKSAKENSMPETTMPSEIMKIRVLNSYWTGMKQGDCKTGQEGLGGGHLPLGTASGVCQDNPNPNPYNPKNNLTLRRAGLSSKTGKEGLDGGHLPLGTASGVCQPQ